MNATSPTIGSTLTDSLRDAIITGEIAQGSKLSETKLAAKLNVSRGPLREALRRLEGMNLIQHAPQQGARVVTLTAELIVEIYHAREALESKAATLAAVNMNSQEIDELNRTIDIQTKQVKENSLSFVPAESDYLFHELIIRGSKNTVIIRALLLELYNLIKMFRYQNKENITSQATSLTEHRQIAYAIQQRDPLLAEITMRQHIVRARENVQRHMSETNQTSSD